MKNIFILAVIFSITICSCENRERLDKIKEKLKSSKDYKPKAKEGSTNISVSTNSNSEASTSQITPEISNPTENMINSNFETMPTINEEPLTDF